MFIFPVIPREAARGDGRRRSGGAELCHIISPHTLSALARVSDRTGHCCTATKTALHTSRRTSVAQVCCFFFILQRHREKTLKVSPSLIKKKKSNGRAVL